jgi:pimeloyl-ACP methyl ester carboxylesterase
MDGVPDIQHRMRDEFEANWPLIVSGAIFSHAVEGAAVANAPGQFPVVVLSHGGGGSGFEYTALIEDLVSHGYVVAAIEHTQSAAVVFFPDGRLVPFHDDPPAPGLSPDERFQHMMKSVSVGIEEGAADVRFVLNRLTELNAGDARQFPLAGRLDLNRVAAMGHSAGAEFAARACQLDARFKACVDLDGGMVPVAALPEYPDGATMKQPLLFLEAFHPESRMGGTPEQHEEYFKKREAQLEKCPAGTYAVVLKSPGIVHGSFSDYSLLAAGGKPDETSKAQHTLDSIETLIRAFLDRTLNHSKDTLFDGNLAANPEASVVPYGH